MILGQPTNSWKPATGLRSGKGRLVITGLFVFISNSSAAPAEPRPRETSIRLGQGRSIVAIRANPKASRSRSVSRTVGNEHPRPPVAGFSPLVAITTGVPGYYMDYVKMNAAGGALEFSKAPFIVLDLPNPEGDPPILPGILGMNFFWNRNVWFDPALTESAAIWLSGPVDFAYGDYDRDLDVDGSDASIFVSCLAGPDGGVLGPECYHLDSEEDGDLDLADFAAFQLCYSGTDVSADPLCKAE